MRNPAANRVGLVIGSGTGKELSEVFKFSLNRIAQMLGEHVEIIECEHQFKSYKELQGLSHERIEEIVREDLKALITFYKKFHQSGGRVIFRTALNAETLYLFRRIAKAVKIIPIPLRSNKNILIVRDEMQGFYTNEEYQIEKTEVRFTGSFSRENLRLVINFALEEGDRILRKPFEVWVVYKHHLFANAIANWAQEFIPHAHIYQPNHATELLFRYFEHPTSGDLLMITGNEVGDILHEVLIFHLGLGTRNTLCSKNMYLHPDYDGLIEYQTVHGSADDIAGRGIVNPFATLRVIAASLEVMLQINCISSIMEDTIKKAEHAGVVTPDMGGRATTIEVVEYVLDLCRHHLSALAKGG